MPKQGGSPWQIVAILFIVACLNYADRSAISSVFPLLRSELGVSDVGLAAIGSFFLWSYAICSPLAGRLADRVSRSRMVVASLALWSFITIATGFTTNSNQLLVTRVLLGVAECAYLPAAIALIADHHSAQTRATAMGVHLAGLNFGLVAGGALSGYLGEHYGWRLGFYVLGAIGLLLAVIAQRVLYDVATAEQRRNAESGKSPMECLRELLRVPSYLIVVAEAMLLAIGIWMFFNWLPLYFSETFQMSLTGAGFSGTFMLQIAATIGVMVGGYLSDRIAVKRLRHRMLFQSLCYFGAAPFLLAFLGQPTYALISTCIFSFSFLRALGASNEHAILCDLLPANLRSTAIGLMNTANCLAGGVGIMFAGVFKQAFGLSGLFAAISGIVLAAALLVLSGYIFFLPRDLSRRHTRESWAVASS